MNDQQIDDIARLASPVRGGYFVSGEVNGVQDVSECLILDRRKKSEIAVGDPFHLRCFAIPFREHGIDEGIAPNPLERIAVHFEESAVLLCGPRDTFLTIMKDINIGGVARRVSGQRRTPRNIALRIAMPASRRRMSD